jgi:hypothetical protein
LEYRLEMAGGGFERAKSPCGSILLLNENRQGPNTSVRPVNPNPAGLGEEAAWLHSQIGSIDVTIWTSIAGPG